MSDNVTDNSGQDPITQRGVYLLADTPLTAVPLALEDGGGDRRLLVETLDEHLTDDELDKLIVELMQISTDRSCDEATALRHETGQQPPTDDTLPSCGTPAIENLLCDCPDSGQRLKKQLLVGFVCPTCYQVAELPLRSGAQVEWAADTGTAHSSDHHE